MKNYIKQILVCIALPTALFLGSCSKSELEPFKEPFFHINVEERSTVEVLSNRKDTVDYKIYLSTELQFEPIDLNYEVKVGNGLVEGRDYSLITKGNKFTFPAGIFERSVRIAWLDSPIDPTKDNTITIRLLSNSKNYTIGLPGPDGLQRELVITKK
jgi:hypothetical protein